METGLDILSSITILLVVKILIIVLMVVYTIFAFLVYKQTVAMTRAIIMKDDYFIKTLSFTHLIVTLIVLVVAIVVL